MKMYFLSIHIFLSGLILFSACSADKEETHKLKVIIPLSCRGYTDLVRLSEYDLYPREYQYDSIKQEEIYTYDSIPEGEIKLEFFSLLTDNYKRTIELDKDTTVRFDAALYRKFVQAIPQGSLNMRLNDWDTLYVGVKNFGCVAANAEKMKIFKIDTSYRIEITNYPSDDIDATSCNISENIFSKAFEKYLKDCEKLFQRPTLNQILILSTSTTKMYVRKDDSIYIFPEVNTNYAYDNFNAEFFKTDQISEHQDKKWDSILIK